MPPSRKEVDDYAGFILWFDQKMTRDFCRTVYTEYNYEPRGNTFLDHYTTTFSGDPVRFLRFASAQKFKFAIMGLREMYQRICKVALSEAPSSCLALLIEILPYLEGRTNVDKLKHYLALENQTRDSLVALSCQRVQNVYETSKFMCAFQGPQYNVFPSDWS